MDAWGRSMDILYINLDRQRDRRSFLESNFQSVKAAHWRLHRVEAVDAAFAATHAVRGRLRDAEKACYLSHIKAIETAREIPGPVMIVEDDVLFGKGSFAAIEALLAATPEEAWDLIFTDVAIGSVHSMIDLFALRRKYQDTGPKLINLTNLLFSGAAAYIINHDAKHKLLDLLPRNGPFEIAYDLLLRMLVHEKRLRASVIFPFATTLSPFAENSGIQGKQDEITDTVLNAFRRLMWLERDIDAAMAVLDRTGAGRDDPETLAFSNLLGAFLSPSFVTK